MKNRTPGTKSKRKVHPSIMDDEEEEKKKKKMNKDDEEGCQAVRRVKKL